MDTPNTNENNGAENAPKQAPQMPQVDKKVGLGVIAYIGPLVIISYILGKDDPFVKFHIKQGLVLLAIEIILWILMSTFWTLWMFYNLIHVGLIILAILGIVNAVQKKEEKLPLVGDFARYFNF